MKLLEEDLNARSAVSCEERAEFLEGLVGVRVNRPEPEGSCGSDRRGALDGEGLGR
jgi:hypothetical protein